jgi:glycosyltransferase involved in cell wall biosynthesis
MALRRTILLMLFAVGVAIGGTTARNPRSESSGDTTAGVTLWWYAPFMSTAGYGTEAVGFITGLDRVLQRRTVAPPASAAPHRVTKLAIAPHGDSISSSIVAEWHASQSERFLGLMDNATYRRLSDVPKQQRHRHAAICHSEPGAWSVPTPNYRTATCPIPGAALRIGRTMFETDRLPEGWVKRMASMDEIWVPSPFNLETFVTAGVPRGKLHIVPEGIDTEMWRPRPSHVGTEASMYSEMFPAKAHHTKKEDALDEEDFWDDGDDDEGDDDDDDFFLRRSAASSRERRMDREDETFDVETECQFKFLSVFKWETRKGWQALLAAFLEEFDRASPNDRACLFIKTTPYHENPNVGADHYQSLIDLFITRSYQQKGRDFRGSALAARGFNTTAALRVLNMKLASKTQPTGSTTTRKASPSRPVVKVMSVRLTDAEMLRLYRDSDCLVQPSHGEGWGRPHQEAMASGLPVMATNWSGTTAFLNNETGFPIPIEAQLSTIDNGPFADHRWANPAVMELRRLMRRVVDDPAQAKAKALTARQAMVEQFDVAVVAQLVLDRVDLLLLQKGTVL